MNNLKDYDKFLDLAAEASSSVDPEGHIAKITADMKRLHDSLCRKLYAEGNRKEVGEHIARYEEVRSQIAAPYKHTHKRIFKAGEMIATNVYDDDRPTTHTVEF